MKLPSPSPRWELDLTDIQCYLTSVRMPSPCLCCLQYGYISFTVKFNSWIFTRYLRNNVLSTLASHGDEHAVDYSLTGFRMWMKNQRLTIHTKIINELKIHQLLLSYFNLLKWRFRHCWSQQYAGRVSQRNQVRTQLTREFSVVQ